MTIWVVAAGYYLVFAASTIYVTSDGRTIATVWPANAVLVALLLIGSKPNWKTVLSAGFAGNLLANWLTRGSVIGPILYSLANGLEVVVTVTFLRTSKLRFDPLKSTNALFRFVITAGLVAPGLSAIVGCATAVGVYSQPFSKSFCTWFLSDSLGLLIFTPVFHSVCNGQYATLLTRLTGRERVEAFLLLGLTACTAYLVFFVASLPTLFVLYAPMMLVTFRVGPSGTKIAVLLIAITGGLGTALGHGPIVMVTSDPVMQAYLFQAALAVMLLTCLPVAAEVAQRNRLAEELRRREEGALIEASTDPLTGLLNRRGFERAVQKALAEQAGKLCCVAVDVDHFKSLNDTWGHPFGDRALSHLAEMLQFSTRFGDIIGRFGGDEFMLIVRTDRDGANAICERVASALRAKPLSPDDKVKLVMRVSLGVTSVYPAEPMHEIFRRADEALYRAKASRGTAENGLDAASGGVGMSKALSTS